MQHERTYIRHYIPWRDYLILCKPKVVLLLLVTAWVGMLLASHSPVITMKMLLATIGIGFAANSAAVLNHIIDSRIDAKMQRTKQRPMVNGRIRTQHALLFAFILGLTSMVLLIVYVNSLTALLTLLGIIGYACVYTMFLKHWTSQNIVFGGLAGALPPLLGWTSITDSIEFEALLLVLIIFVWTPAHFWPLAIDRVNDYQKAKIPMLPVTHGVSHTKNCIVIYSLLLAVVSLLPYFYGMSGVIYLFCAMTLASYFLFFTIKLKFSVQLFMPMKTFRASIIYLLLLFIALLSDHAFTYY